MSKLICVLLLVLPVLVFADVGFGSAQEPATFEFILPSVVAVFLSDANITWDFSNITVNANNPAFPPAGFPEYYEPSSPNVRPYQTIDYLVMFAGASVNWSLTVAGGGDPAPACGITLGEIEYADNPPTWPGTPFSTTPAVLQSGSGSTGGWAQMEHNYRVGIDGGESNTATSSCVITYTITAL